MQMYFKVTFSNVLIIAFFFLTVRASFSQTWLWAKSATEGSDMGVAVSADPVGNVFVTGSFGGPTITFGSTTLTNADGSIFVCKYDESGNVLWAKGGEGNGGGRGTSVSSDKNGNVFVTGFFGADIVFDSDTLTYAGGFGYDGFIAKYHASGNLIWAKRIGGTGDDEGLSVSTDTSGNVFVTGYFSSSTITFDTITLNNPGNGENVFIAKYDSVGNILWAKSTVVVAGSSLNEGTSVSADKDGNVFLTGKYSSATIIFDTITLTNLGTLNAFMAKYDMAGNLLWAENIGGLFMDEGYSVSTDEDGNAYVTYTGSDVFINKYDASGNVLWTRNAVGTGWDIGYSVSTDPCGNVYLTGKFDGDTIAFGSTILTRPVNSDAPIFIVKYDASGNVICATALASGGTNQFGISADSFGNAFISGGNFNTNPFVVGSTTITNMGVFVAKLNCNNKLIDGVVQTNVSCNGLCTGSGSVIMGNGTPPFTYNWNSSPMQNTQTATGLCAGTYVVLVSDACITFTDTITISQPAVFTTTASAVATNIVIGSSTTLWASAGVSYQWTPATGLSCTSCQSPVASQLETTDYCVIAIDSNGCDDTACITITVEIPCGKLEVPTAFSPNNDGHNDLFLLQGLDKCVSTFSCIIFDRWGEKVFETESLSVLSWDGTFKGKPLNPAVFVYYIDATFISGEHIIKKGNISLIR